MWPKGIDRGRNRILYSQIPVGEGTTPPSAPPDVSVPIKSETLAPAAAVGSGITKAQVVLFVASLVVAVTMPVVIVPGVAVVYNTLKNQQLNTLTQLSTIQTDTNSLITLTNSHSQNLVHLNTTTTTTTERLTQINSTVQTITYQYSTFIEPLLNVNANESILALSAAVSILQDTDQTFNGRFTTLNQTVATQQGQINTAQSAISTLQQTSTNHATRIGTLEQSVQTRILVETANNQTLLHLLEVTANHTREIAVLSQAQIDLIIRNLNVTGTANFFGSTYMEYLVVNGTLYASPSGGLRVTKSVTFEGSTVDVYSNWNGCIGKACRSWGAHQFDAGIDVYGGITSRATSRFKNDAYLDDGAKLRSDGNTVITAALEVTITGNNIYFNPTSEVRSSKDFYMDATRNIYTHHLYHSGDLISTSSYLIKENITELPLDAFHDRFMNISIYQYRRTREYRESYQVPDVLVDAGWIAEYYGVHFPNAVSLRNMTFYNSETNTNTTREIPQLTKEHAIPILWQELKHAHALIANLTRELEILRNYTMVEIAAIKAHLGI
jgi:hypothetical protein